MVTICVHIEFENVLLSEDRIMFFKYLLINDASHLFFLIVM